MGLSKMLHELQLLLQRETSLIFFYIFFFTSQLMLKSGQSYGHCLRISGLLVLASLYRSGACCHNQCEIVVRLSPCIQKTRFCFVFFFVCLFVCFFFLQSSTPYTYSSYILSSASSTKIPEHVPLRLSISSLLFATPWSDVGFYFNKRITIYQ